MGKPKTTKKPRVGYENKFSPTKKKLKKKLVKKAERRAGKKVTVEEKTLIVNFIKQLSEEKYQQANKYLQELVQYKLKAKIASCVEDNLF